MSPRPIVVLCPHFTPDTAPTGEIMARIVEEFVAEGRRVHVVTALPWYRSHAIEEGWGGRLVRRERTEIERDIDHYSVIEHDGIIFGCAALYPYPESRTAEMAALTVSPLSQGQGDGERLLKRIEHRARAMGIDSIFVLTTRTMHWFIRRGFVQVDPEWLPEARKRKYNWDRKSQVLVKKL